MSTGQFEVPGLQMAAVLKPRTCGVCPREGKCEEWKGLVVGP